MPEVTDDCRAPGTSDLVHVPEPEAAECEPWICLYYDERGDAFEAAKAADLLGLSWRLATHRYETDDVAVEQWVVELLLDHTLPAGASSSISRDVE